MSTIIKIDTPLTIFDKVIEIICCAIVVGMIISTIVFYGKLPDIIPIHYNAQGVVDDYGSKLYIIAQPIIALVIYAGMTIIPFQSKFFIHSISNGKTRIFRLVKLCAIISFALILLKTIVISTAY